MRRLFGTSLLVYRMIIGKAVYGKQVGGPPKSTSTDVKTFRVKKFIHLLKFVKLIICARNQFIGIVKSKMWSARFFFYCKQQKC